MIKLFIVDDEDMEREGIRSLFDWKQFGVTVIGEAWNGHAALEALEHEEPDLVITDVRMPGMNGLQFASRLKRMYPNVKYIFISGYEDFDAARNAVDVNAVAYLMKPINKETLMQTIAGAIGRIEEEKHRVQEGDKLRHQVEENMPVLREQLLRDLLLGIEPVDGERTIQQAQSFGLALPTSRTAVMILKVKELSPDSEEAEPLKAVTVHRELSRIIQEETGLPAVMTREGEYTVLVPSSPILSPEEAEEHVEQLAASWMQQLNRTTGLTYAIGIALAEDGIRSCHRYCRLARMAASRSMYSDVPSVMWHEDHEDSRDEFPIALHRSKEELTEAIITSDTEKIEAIIRACFQNKAMKKEQAWFVAVDLLTTALHTLAEKRELMKAAFEQEKAPWDKLMHMETIDSLVSWVIVYVQNISELIRKNQGNKHEHIVQTIKQWVKSEYMTDITIDSIASRVFLAPGYVRKLFKNQTGMTLKEYIVQTRMKCASELLRQPERKVNEVAAAVGYENVSYFCAVFKSFYGLSPGEFKDAYHFLA
ncbi:YesN/AraC family two-component response regulator [Paenibacillus taihuensis]|uniref:YesN/AraC family two-component response regulator n=1 Tax=Paenibacillus taihuensis TaxID=1156355 RepID=A0A3D9RM78_9BACL|nr:response regulator [Paenibacillus taihuensis]REE81009.1 YesN/AraC family two-component response regulator [Paenibacillus taihuensis]